MLKTPALRAPWPQSDSFVRARAQFVILYFALSKFLRPTFNIGRTKTILGSTLGNNHTFGHTV